MSIVGLGLDVFCAVAGGCCIPGADGTYAGGGDCLGEGIGGSFERIDFFMVVVVVPSILALGGRSR